MFGWVDGIWDYLCLVQVNITGEKSNVCRGGRNWQILPFNSGIHFCLKNYAPELKIPTPFKFLLNQTPKANSGIFNSEKNLKNTRFRICDHVIFSTTWKLERMHYNFLYPKPWFKKKKTKHGSWKWGLWLV